MRGWGTAYALRGYYYPPLPGGLEVNSTDILCPQIMQAYSRVWTAVSSTYETFYEMSQWRIPPSKPNSLLNPQPQTLNLQQPREFISTIRNSGTRPSAIMYIMALGTYVIPRVQTFSEGFGVFRVKDITGSLANPKLFGS